VIGWGWTYKGQSLCYSGATSGARRGHKVGGAFTTICGDEIYGHRECYNDMISAKVPGGMLGGLGGDSGPRSSNSPTTTRRYAPWARSRAAPSG
jgi:streptogrisin D